MASINGITVKSYKTFRGHEGEPLGQGNVYYKGKKLGFWSQDAYGAVCDNFDFDEKILTPEVEKYRDLSGMVREEFKDLFDTTTFMWELSNLLEAEKEYKKFAKKGYPTMIRVTNGSYATFTVFKISAITAKEKAVFLSRVKDRVIDSFKKETPKSIHENIHVDIFGCLRDFDIVYA